MIDGAADDWSDLADWWIGEIAGDPAYQEQVIPGLLELLEPAPEARYLDLGCGEGQVLRAVAEAGALPIGCDLNRRLLAAAATSAPVVACRLPDLAWARPGAFDGAYACLVVEHLPELDPLFTAAGEAIRPGGVLVVLLNHPFFTPPGSAPLLDPADGEILWRWGDYLEQGTVAEPVEEARVAFVHRPVGMLLEAAAAAGWFLERCAEWGVSAPAAGRDPILAAQRHLPRLMGLRWRRR